MFGIRRREFFTLLGGAARVADRGARAAAAKLPTLGFLGAGTPLTWEAMGGCF